MKTSKPVKKSVQLSPSRIRRDPVREEKELFWRSREWEIRLSVAGIVLFALALSAIWFGINHAVIY